MYGGIWIRTSDSQQQCQWEETGATSLKYWKKKNHQHRNQYPANLSFKNESKIKTFSDI